MLTALYFLLLVWLILSIILRKRPLFFDARMIVELGIIIYYVIPGIRHSDPEHFDYTSGSYLLYGYKYDATYKAFFCVVIFYLLFLFGYYIKKKFFFSFGERNRETKRIKYSASTLEINNEKQFVSKLSKIVITASFGLFLIYCSFYGGFRELMLNIADIRGGIIESSESSFSFINKLYRCAPFALYIIADYWNDKAMRPQIIVTGILSGIIVISYGGRGVLLQFILIIIMGNYIFRKVILNKKYQFKKIIIILAVVVFALVIYRPLLIAIGQIQTVGFSNAIKNLNEILQTSNRYNASSLDSIITSMLRSTDHYSVSLETAIHYVDTGVHHQRYLLELLIDVISIIPSVLSPFKKAPTITYYNSMYISGMAKRAQIPSGIIGEAYYSGGIVWIILYAIIVGMVAYNIDHMYKKINKRVGFASTYYFAILFLLFGFAIGGDYGSMLQKNLTTFMIIFIIQRRMKKGESSNYVQ